MPLIVAQYLIHIGDIGYSAPGVEKVVKDVFDADELKKRRARALDVKESFECGREDSMLMPNIWLPDGILPGFKEACLDFFWVSNNAPLEHIRKSMSTVLRYSLVTK